MILAIDIGNSNIVIGGVEQDQILFEARLRTETTKTSDQYCVDLKILLDVYGVNREDIEGAIIASVVPQVLNSMQTAVKKPALLSTPLGKWADIITQTTQRQFVLVSKRDIIS